MSRWTLLRGPLEFLRFRERTWARCEAGLPFSTCELCLNSRRAVNSEMLGVAVLGIPGTENSFFSPCGALREVLLGSGYFVLFALTSRLNSDVVSSGRRICVLVASRKF